MVCAQPAGGVRPRQVEQELRPRRSAPHRRQARALSQFRYPRVPVRWRKAPHPALRSTSPRDGLGATTTRASHRPSHRVPGEVPEGRMRVFPTSDALTHVRANVALLMTGRQRIEIDDAPNRRDADGPPQRGSYEIGPPSGRRSEEEAERASTQISSIFERGAAPLRHGRDAAVDDAVHLQVSRFRRHRDARSASAACTCRCALQRGRAPGISGSRGRR